MTIASTKQTIIIMCNVLGFLLVNNATTVIVVNRTKARIAHKNIDSASKNDEKVASINDSNKVYVNKRT